LDGSASFVASDRKGLSVTPEQHADTVREALAWHPGWQKAEESLAALAFLAERADTLERERDEARQDARRWKEDADAGVLLGKKFLEQSALRREAEERLDEKLSVESADRYLAYRFNRVYDDFVAERAAREEREAEGEQARAEADRLREELRQVKTWYRMAAWEGSPDPGLRGGGPYTPNERARGYGTFRDPRFLPAALAGPQTKEQT
jgi:hypothetical protein